MVTRITVLSVAAFGGQAMAAWSFWSVVAAFVLFTVSSVLLDRWFVSREVGGE